MNCLIVISEETQGSAATESFKEIGMNTLCLNTCNEAQLYLEEHKTDVLLIDFEGDSKDALTFLKKIKTEKRDAVGFIAALVHPSESLLKLKVLQGGADSYFLKPLQAADVLSTLEAVYHPKTTPQGSKRGAGEFEEDSESKAGIGSAENSMEILNLIMDPICILDVSDKICFANKSFREVTGYSPEEINEGRGIAGLILRAQSWGLVVQECQQKGGWKGELDLRLRNDRVLTTLCRVDKISDVGLINQGKIMIFVDITSRKQLEQELLFLVNYDSLTGLSNRRCFTESLEKAIFDARNGSPGALLYLDLDNFKVVNDSAGHAAGDKLLREIAHLLKENTGKDDVVARFGGDEFTILFKDTTLHKALDTTRKLVSKMDQFRFLHEDKVFSASASIGVVFIDGTSNSDEVLSQADLASYYVKNKGRNGYSVYKADAAELQKLNSDAAWSITIRDSIKDKRFELWLQPIRRCGSPINTYYEVLIRMRDQKGNLVMPGAFLPAAERFGLMDQVDAYVIEHSIRLLSTYPQLKLSINLSAKSLNDPGLPSSIERWFRELKVNPNRAVFEITETDIIKNMAYAKDLINRIRNLGSQFALDDFGAGASSMSYLRDLPVELVKIDGSFIRGMASDPISRAIVASINEIAHILGRKTVAEFVLNKEVYQIVQDIGIDYGQGYFLCPPSPATSFFPKQRGDEPSLQSG